jgi:hypothetical protein
MYDCDSGRRLLTEVEAKQAALEAERAAREAAEAEVQRLRNKLKEQGLSE